MRRPEIDAEELLGSRGRIRVLRVLSESGELNISEVGRRTGMNYTSVERHLEALTGMGLLREKRYGKIRIFEAAFRSLTVRFERQKGVRVETEREDRSF
ncbi:MAG TPA: helix-turn-helix domain-containing protein [Patescibacteria group bacterium]|nr:helix-turn-helix domain-containing protein [Patescibacteria group bacterium]